MPPRRIELATIEALGDLSAVTLPGIEIAFIEERKVIGYLLAADHPEDASKAAFFWIVDSGGEIPRLVNAYSMDV